MLPNRSLSRTQRDSLLRLVCTQRVGMDVLRVEGDRVARHKSRFLALKAEGDGSQLLIECPTHDGKPMAYHLGEVVNVAFVVAQAYGFSTEVEMRTHYRIEGDGDVPALALAYPEMVETRERRAHYRVLLDSGEVCTAAFCEWLKVDSEVPAFDDTNLYSAMVRDIGAGGLAMHCVQRLPDGLGVGSKLLVSFQLPRGGEHMNLEAAIRDEREPLAGEGRVLGIEFLKFEETMCGQEALHHIQRFVVSRIPKTLEVR